MVPGREIAAALPVCRCQGIGNRTTSNPATHLTYAHR